MALYVVSYDLHNQRTYEPVWAALETMGAVKLLESLWLLETALKASEVRDLVVAAADNDDSVAVVEIKPGGSWGTTRALKEGVSWLKQNMA